MKRLAILQSNYIPWKGFFDIIRAVDEVVIYDCCQYTKRDWRNRNFIKKHDGLMWLTIPVVKGGSWDNRICDTKVANSSWASTHWDYWAHYYKRAPFFLESASLIKETYESCEQVSELSLINVEFIKSICTILNTPFSYTWSMDLCLESREPTDRIVEICEKCMADEYLSGPTAKDYLRVEAFEDIGCNVHWMDYSGYAEYPQMHPPFVHGVSILDLLFNVGPSNASRYMLDTRDKLDEIVGAKVLEEAL